MSKKFIPNGDLDFATMAAGFARTLAKAPARYAAAEADAAELVEKVEKYQAALQAARHGVRTPAVTQAKEIARGEAEAVIRRLANVARATKSVDRVALTELGIRERADRPKQAVCPQEPPRLRFVRAHHESAATPRHELAFTSIDWKSKPEGAARLELFVDLIPPEEPIPASPGACVASGGRPWYLRSFTRSPIVLVPPLARVPMRVVYWGRWAGTTGDVGPFSATAVGWIEGGSHAMLPGGVGMQFAGGVNGRKAVEVIDHVRTAGGAALPEAGEGERAQRYVIAVLEAQMRAVVAGPVERAALPGPECEQRLLEGPGEAEAA